MSINFEHSRRSSSSYAILCFLAFPNSRTPHHFEGLFLLHLNAWFSVHDSWQNRAQAKRLDTIEYSNRSAAMYHFGIRTADDSNRVPGEGCLASNHGQGERRVILVKIRLTVTIPLLCLAKTLTSFRSPARVAANKRTPRNFVIHHVPIGIDFRAGQPSLGPKAHPLVD